MYSEKFDKYYIGQTNDIANRLLLHSAGTEKATQPYIPWQMIWHTEKPARSEAMGLEKKLKNLSRERIQQLLKNIAEDSRC